MVVGFIITFIISDYHHTKVVSSNPAHDEVYSIQHYVIKFDSDLRQVGGFLRILQFPTPRYNWNIAENDVKHHNPNIALIQFRRSNRTECNHHRLKRPQTL
jgi:hypothetical protein